MRRVFMTRQFSRWLRKTELTELALCLAVTEMSNGLIDADMGGGVLKKRIAMPGRGKSGSARTLLADKQDKPLVLCLWVREERTRQCHRERD